MLTAGSTNPIWRRAFVGKPILSMAMAMGFVFLVLLSAGIALLRNETASVESEVNEPIAEMLAEAPLNAGQEDAKGHGGSKLPDLAPDLQSVSDGGATSLEEYEASRRMVMDRVTDFEQTVIDSTYAVHVRVETPSLMAWSKFDPDVLPPEDAFRSYGYIAFAATPEAFKDDVYYTMEDIADSYFRTFPEAPTVKVSLIIGNAVRNQETFHNQNLIP